MTNKKATKKALFASAMSLLLCVAMLIGSTFAWFTDSASSKGNKIMAGNLDVDLLLWDGDSYEDIGDSEDPIFGSYNSDEAQDVNSDTLWEPGKTQVAYLKIKNNGNLALKYQVVLNTVDPADSKSLYEVMQYQIVPDAVAGDVDGWDANSALKAKLGTEIVSGDAAVEMDPGAEHNFALLVHMDENANNDYMDGKVEFDITVLATQLNAEEDSFGKDYDKDSQYPPVAWDGSVDTSWFDAGKTEFTISDGAQLAGLAKLGNQLGGKTIILDSDIDLGGMNWTPIHIFVPEQSFTFDGGNHTISNLNVTSGSDKGLFDNSVGTIKNLKLSDAQIKSGGRSAILAGRHYGDIINCHVKDSTVEDSYWAAGGIVGMLNSGNIRNCSVTNVNVKSNGGVGGIVGLINETGGTRNVENCSVNGGTIENTGIYGSPYTGGGIVGMINISNSTVNIKGCSSTATLKGSYIYEICPPADSDVTLNIN